ncbi:hypothetical protein [Vibrio owensii]|uniref:hypothetical protein n=1 Tax=Vibrio owensii TaxID=696485 RepID=UPI0018F2707D|nr:hypothetical protein [Vibrio owensii]
MWFKRFVRLFKFDSTGFYKVDFMGKDVQQFLAWFGRFRLKVTSLGSVTESEGSTNVPIESLKQAAEVAREVKESLLIGSDDGFEDAVQMEPGRVVSLFRKSTKSEEEQEVRRM